MRRRVPESARPGLPCVALACLLASGAVGDARAQDCSIEPVGQAKLSQRNGHFEVPVSINGQPELPFVVDTGAEGSSIHAHAAAQLELPVRPARRTRITGTDGEKGPSSPNVTAQRLEFAGVQRFDLPLVVKTLMFEGKPANQGILGANLLSSYDVEFDFPRAQLTLYRVRDCAPGDPAFRPWSTPHNAVPLKRSARGLLSLPVLLDGKEVELILDTGATRSKVSMQVAADKLGLDLDALKASAPHSTSYSVTGKSMSNYGKRFARVAIGKSVYGNVEIKVSDIRVDPYDGLLGMDFLRNRRVWVSYATGQLLVDETRPR